MNIPGENGPNFDNSDAMLEKWASSAPQDEATVEALKAKLEEVTKEYSELLGSFAYAFANSSDHHLQKDPAAKKTLDLAADLLNTRENLKLAVECILD